jgi:hypothetical protein
MYGDLEDFQTAAMECGVDYYADGSLQQDKIEAAFKIYRNIQRLF